MAVLRVRITAQIDDQPPVSLDQSRTVPPDYNAADIAAFTVRSIEDSAFALTREAFGRQPTRAALLAYVARQRGVELAVEEGPGDLVARIRAVLALSNTEAMELYGEDVEGS